MTIKDIEARSEMSRANIRYYESLGLLTPARKENSYRDYSQSDLDTLLKIKLLRSLDVSLDDIAAETPQDSAESHDEHGVSFGVLIECIDGLHDAPPIAIILQIEKTATFCRFFMSFKVRRFDDSCLSSSMSFHLS